MLLRRLCESLESLKKGCDPILQELLKATCTKMNLVSREEFDAQNRVLEKAQRMLAELEAELRDKKERGS